MCSKSTIPPGEPQHRAWSRKPGAWPLKIAHTGPFESEAHSRCKREIFDALKAHVEVTEVHMERSLGTVRPDVSAIIRGVPVAIEIQISHLSEETIVHRTMEYAKKDICVLWLPQWTPALESKRYSPSSWEKWLHATYFGRVYFWVKGLTIAEYRFDPAFLTIPRTAWCAKGKQFHAGGYSRRSKRCRTAVRVTNLNLATDFESKERDWWEQSEMKIPWAKLYMHKSRGSVQI